MKAPWLYIALALAVSPLMGATASPSWKKFVLHSTGTTVDIPSIFSEDAGPTEDGEGRRFLTGDGRADLTVQAIPNDANDSPAAFLARKRPPADIVYKKVTPDFFVVSSIRNGKIWYDRCNRSVGYMDCVLINYPATEKRQWDGIVTRISSTLRRT